MKYIVTLKDKKYEVEVEQGEARVISVSQAASPIVSSPAAPAAPAAAPTAPAAAAAGGDTVTAPMPGTVLEVKVQTGASVKAGDVLVVLEAMKMENDITAPKDGTVKQILCSKGASVATGDVLVVM